jgi:flagellar basal-body rod protein FlgB
MRPDKLFGVHPQALQLRAKRAEVLAANMANADTPGYKARDVDFKQVLRGQLNPPVQVVTTRKGHIQPGQNTAASSLLRYRVPQQSSLDGNTVEIETEQSHFSANAMRYQATLRFLDGRIKGLMTALKGN